MRRERVTVELPGHLLRELEEAADDRGETRNQVARDWIGRWLER